MIREIITPKDKEHWLAERAKDLTSTEVSALFNISPYATALEVWHRKKSNYVTTLEENERMKWGNRLEASIANGIAEDNGWTVLPLKDYMRIPELRIGASFDYGIYRMPGILAELLEIKNVDALQYLEKWGEDDNGNLEAPPHIELQLQHQMLVSGVKSGYIGALVGGNSVNLIKREADPAIQTAILKKTAAFWHSIDHNIEPEPDFEKDSAFIISMMQTSKPGKVFNAKDNEEIKQLALEDKEAFDEIKRLEGVRQTCKAKILTIIGDAEKVIGGPFSSITASTVNATEVPAYTREGYRLFKINWPRAKKQK